jgi:hypothetical protein
MSRQWPARANASREQVNDIVKETSATTTTTVLIDRAFQSIMHSMVRLSNAPDHFSLAAVLGLEPDEGLEMLQTIMLTGYPGWLDKNDVIVTFCPFPNVTNAFKITVDGEGNWFGQ